MGRLITPEIVGGAGHAGQPGDGYLTRLAKLLPAEVLSAYVGFENIFANRSNQPFHPPADMAGRTISYLVAGNHLAVLAFFVLLAANPVIVWLNRKQGQPFVVQMILTTIGFVIWVYATRGAALFPWYQPQFAGVLVGIYTFGVSYIYKPRIRAVAAPPAAAPGAVPAARARRAS